MRETCILHVYYTHATYIRAYTHTNVHTYTWILTWWITKLIDCIKLFTANVQFLLVVFFLVQPHTHIHTIPLLISGQIFVLANKWYILLYKYGYISIFILKLTTRHCLKGEWITWRKKIYLFVLSLCYYTHCYV